MENSKFLIYATTWISETPDYKQYRLIYKIKKDKVDLCLEIKTRLPLGLGVLTRKEHRRTF